ncbi:alpha/beta fold hydrolase [Salinisphaera orenii]|uniref:Carboxymuconolactone decarboxylase n=1 Tax=Salinisphaera orenii YIM 95161 TaxID=1051139 RepID=A0A423PTQ3_9GAMM|nr:alpha/beta fold hydrolase [Salinisphaera halophila]ROO28979.1 carboxymuconolactone decarboxylase [Salinisphaera halophila YIM 95161]
MAFVECNGRVICYQESGETALPAVLFAHPLGMSQQVWADVVARLRGRYRCIRWDLPGHGASAPASTAVTARDLARDAQALLAALGVERCGFVGTSIGGVIGQALLLDAPEWLDRVVLTNTGAAIGTPDAWQQRAARVRSEGLEQMAAELSQRWFADAYKDQQPAGVAGWTHQLARTDDESYARLCELLAEADFRGKLAGVDRPVCLIAGAEDPATPVSALEALADELGGAPLDTIDDVAHVPSVEDSDAFTDSLLHAFATNDDDNAPPLTYAQGLETRKSVLGSEHVERAGASATTLDASFQDLITRYAWGELWGNPDLSRTQRSLITTAILAALGRDGELILHLKTAQRIGVSEAELRQALMHVAIYAGVPAANHAFKLAKEQGWGSSAAP